MTEPLLLAAAWRDALSALGADLDGTVLLGGRDVERVALEMGAPVREVGPALVLMGEDVSAELGDDASPLATGLADDSVDSVAMLAAWDGGPQLEAVAIEAARVVRPGGNVWFGDIDAEALVASTPATYAAAILYQARPDISAAVLRGHEGSSRLALAASRARLQPVTSLATDLPWAGFSAIDEYVEAVRVGAWPGMEQLAAAEQDALLSQVHDRFVATPFPRVEYLPWLLVRGRRSG